MAQEDHAIVVGITTYPGFKDLEGSEHDADAFIKWLKHPAKGAVPDANISFRLTSKNHPPAPGDVAEAHPWEDEINDLFRPLVKKAAIGTRIGRRLYIYAAGHGFADPADMSTAAIYAANAEDFFTPHVTASAYAEFFRRAAVFDEIVLIMDCCRTASGLQSVRVPLMPNIPPRAGAKNVRMFTAFGASWGSPSREKTFDTLDQKCRGIFTVALLEALDRCEADDNGNVTGAMVKNYIHNRIDEIAKPVKIDPPEIPIASKDVTLLTRPTPSTKVTFNVPAAAVGRELIVSQPPVEIRRQAIAAAQFDVALKAGLYKAGITGFQDKMFEVGGEETTVTF